MSELSKVKSCRDITDGQIADAIESREDTRALLDHAAKISSPRTGGARVLLLFARMASPNCDWLDGALRVDITGDADACQVETFADIGAGLKERIFPAFTLNVPIEEFVIAVKKFPKAIAPLAFVRPSPRKLVLTAGEVEKVEKASSAPPPRRVKTPAPLSLGDLPTVGTAPKTKSAPPAAHIPAVVMSASEVPPAPAKPQIPKFPAKTELKMGGALKFPAPVKKKVETQPILPAESPKPPVVESPKPPVVESPKPPVVESPKPPVVEAKKPRIATMAYPVLEPPMPPPAPPPPPPVAEPPKSEPEAPKPLARISLKKQPTANLPRVVEEIDARPSARKKTAAVVPPPIQKSEPKADEPAEKKKDVDEGWE